MKAKLKAKMIGEGKFDPDNSQMDKEIDDMDLEELYGSELYGSE